MTPSLAYERDQVNQAVDASNDDAPHRELTRQQLDPAGSIGLRVVTIIFAAGAFGYGCIMTVVTQAEIANPLLAAVALVFLGLACLLVILGSRPHRAPLLGRVHLAAHSLALAAFAAEILSQWEKNALVRDDWGPICLGLILVALSSYRPAGEIATAGIFSSIFIGFITLLQVPYFVTAAPPVTFVIIAVTPMLALSFSAAAFSRKAVMTLLRRQSADRAAAQALVAEARNVVARSVERDRVKVLGLEVLPFFSDLLARDSITEQDRERARAIAASVRLLMVQDVERSWLESLNMPSVLVSDDSHAASEMIAEQRTALRAFLVAVGRASTPGRPAVHVELSRGAVLCEGTLTAVLSPESQPSRSDLVPLVAELRATFVEIYVEHGPDILKMRFSYEQR